MAWNKFVAKLPKGLSAEDRLSIGRDIIEYIERRAIEENKGFYDGREKKFPKYEKEYAKKKGTSPSNVDLVLSADMFNAVEVLSNRSGAVTIGIPSSSPEAGKAEGNIKGTYGQSSPIPGKARPFLGLPDSKLQEIIAKYVD